MAGVPYTFGSATTSIPLSQLDSNFTTPVTIGTTTVALGNTTTTLAGLTSVATNTLTSAAATALTLQSAGSTAITVDTSQNVGIGTASPTQKLDVRGQGYFQSTSADAVVEVNSSGGSGRSYQIRSQSGGQFYVYDNTAGSARMVIDSSGNVGIGATPVAMTNSVGLQVGTNTIVQQVVSNQSMISANAYYAGSWKAAATITGYAAMRLNATSPGAISFHGSSSAYTAGDSLPNMDGSDLKMTINPSGIVFINTTTDNTAFLNINHEGTTRYALSCNNTNTGSASQTAIRFNRGTSYTQVGTITTTNAATSYSSGSDYRLKENIQPMTGALAKVALLKPVTFNWTIDGSDGQGFIAHELQEVCPDAVTGSKDAIDENGKPEYQGVDTSFLVATLTASIQEQQALIQSLTTRIASQDADIAALKAKVGI